MIVKWTLTVIDPQTNALADRPALSSRKALSTEPSRARSVRTIFTPAPNDEIERAEPNFRATAQWTITT